MKKQNKTKQSKRPISIILIMIWMVIAAFSTLFKQFNLERLEMNKQIMGGVLALSNYFIDFFILIGFVTFIVLFWKRKRAWKQFIGFIIFLIAGELFSFVYIIMHSSEILEPLRITNVFSPKLLIIISLIVLLLHLLFYVLIIYFTYKNRNYFINKNDPTTSTTKNN